MALQTSTDHMACSNGAPWICKNFKDTLFFVMKTHTREKRPQNTTEYQIPQDKQPSEAMLTSLVLFTFDKAHPHGTELVHF